MGTHEDRILRLVTDARNRAILSALDGAAGPLHVEELAERLVARESAVFEPSAHGEELERVLITLHHNRLPKLADAGLVEYDRDGNVVSAVDHTTADPEWLEFEMLDELLARFRPDRRPDEDAVGVIEGREDVYDYTRRLADEAEDELFLIYLSDDLLDEGCLPHARNAIDRGVNLRVGSQNPDVREFFRTNLPEATLWEPQLDWANDPSCYPRVDRLILADREKVAFGLLDGPDSDGKSTETAMVGEGKRNPLVVLVRELLGPRLDHLDHQSADFTDRLPNET
ncbi:ArsR family transcriptional regulator [Halorarum halophilum]|uniref:ArsR family transcriptional regulator n=1 Tax=Halorarum halophilum TaxID=2743090 RepID=A0A7D5GFP0_9EURY|nr:ArsR family transcriptional regulator [Halobaculum halophilum]QLG27910.1 ArsR family transcriptional regulator [Halobaculum halophilum]